MPQSEARTPPAMTTSIQTTGGAGCPSKLATALAPIAAIITANAP
jgi:hypothetical protein